LNGIDPLGWEDIISYADLNKMSAVTQFMLKKLACGVVGLLFNEAEKLLGITGFPASLGGWGAGVI